MFCSRCGSESSESAGFCQGCGARLIVDSTTQQSTDVQTDFKEFVDNHVKTNTRFTTANDLLTRAKPLNFIWKCFGVTALIWLSIGLISGSLARGDILGFVAIIALFGYVAAYIMGRIKFAKRTLKGYPLHYKVDLHDLTRFMNDNLKYISLDFGEWEYSDERNALRCGFRGKKIDALIRFDSINEEKLFYTISARKVKV